MNKKIELQKLSGFYEQLAVLDSAGLTFQQIFELLSKSETDQKILSQYRYLAKSIQQGKSFSISLSRSELVPEFDIPLIEAAEKMGRLPEFLKKLAGVYRETFLSIREIKSQLYQPLLTLVLAILVPDFPKFFAGQITGKQYALSFVPHLLILFFSILFIFWIWNESLYDKSLRKKFYSALYLIPGVKNYVHKISLEKFCLTLQVSIDSGIDIWTSIKMASAASGLTEIEAATQRMLPMIKEGVSLDRVLQSESIFPGDLTAAIQLGLNSGELPEFIDKYRDRLNDDISLMQKWIVKLIPRIVYILVTLYAAATIIGFYQGHFNELNKALSD